MPVPTERPKSRLLGSGKSGKQHRSTKAVLVMVIVVIVVGLTSTYFESGSIKKSVSLSTNLLRQQMMSAIQQKECETPMATDGDDAKPRVHAVVHMGPYKTGTTAIQEASMEYREALAEDGYEMPLNKMYPGFGDCFANRARLEQMRLLGKASCDIAYLLDGLDIARRNRNLFVSSEMFAGNDDRGTEMLASYLSPFVDVTIVVNYRRYYAWLLSLYNQNQRNHPEDSYSLSDMITKNTRKTNFGYVVPLINRLKKKFPNVVVMNYHNESTGGAVESLFCHAMKDANNTCDAIRAKSSSARENVGMDTEYIELVVGARDAGLVKYKSREEMMEFARAAETRQKETLSLTTGDLKRRCLPKSILDSLWDQSLAFETALFPQQVRSPGNDLESDFEEYATSKLCELDVESVLGEEQWKLFFKKLGQGASAGLSTKTSVASYRKESATKTDQTPMNSDGKAAKPKMHAVIHMGPHKTGSTSIQAFANDHLEALAEDGYEMPLNYTHTGTTFAWCFRPSQGIDKYHTCNADKLKSGLDIARRNRNLFVSAEALDGTTEQGLYKLASYLSPWDKVTIVVYYRRYYAWLASFYNQAHKLFKTAVHRNDSLVDYITRFTKETHGAYVVPLVARLQNEFPNIVVMNFHNKSMGGSVESLFCHAMKDASSMCSAIRADKSSKTEVNVGVNLDYIRLAVGARNAGLIGFDSNDELERFARAVEARREETGGDFKKRCPPASVLDSLWNQSLAFETSLFPRQVESPGDDLKSDFEEYATSKLCEVDVESVLGEEQWKSFFQELGEEQAVPKQKKEAAAEKNREE